MKIKISLSLVGLLLSYNLFSQSTSYINIDTLSGSIYTAGIKQCPGKISGQCWRTIRFMSNKAPKRSDFKKSRYNIKDGELLIFTSIFDIYDVLTKTGLVKRLDISTIVSSQDESNGDFFLIKKSKFYLLAKRIENQPVIIVEVPIKLLENIISDREIQLGTNLSIVKVGLLVDPNSSFYINIKNEYSIR